MADRHEVQPHHVLRAVLGDGYAAELLAAVGSSAQELRLTLDGLWLEASEEIGPEEIGAVGIDVATLLALLNPPYDGAVAADGRRLTEPARDVLVAALRTNASMRHPRTGTGHLLVALLRSRDPLVSATCTAHRVPVRAVTDLVATRGRRA
ncbi:hypothetical protein BH11ACT8_BH11ACT8_09120 [soil metagenome]